MFVFMAPTAQTGASSDLAWYFSLNPAAPGVLTVTSPTSASLLDPASGIQVEFTGVGFSALLGQPFGGTVSEIRAYSGGILQVTAQPIPGLAFNLIRFSSFAAAFDGQSNAIYDNTASEILAGGSQGDTFLSSSGDDTLYGEGGDDSLGIGDVAISHFPNARSLRIDGGDGVDALVVGNSNAMAGGGMANLATSEFYNIERVVLTQNAVLRVNGWAFWLDNHLGRMIESSGGTRLEVDLGQLGNFDFDTLTYQVFTGSHSNVGFGSSLNNSLRGADLWSDTLYGANGRDNLAGRGGNDHLDGGADNDTLNGGAGADTLEGGNGDDLYIIDDTQDRLIERLGRGHDRVITTVDLTLAKNVEDVEAVEKANVTLQGNSINNRIDGNGGHNRLLGNGGDDLLNGFGGNDTISGGTGNDTLDGGVGHDSLSGGAGDDFYFVDSTSDRVTEAAGGGNDMVYTSVSMTLGAEVENAHLQGSALTLRGNASANALYGNDMNNVLSGLGGDDFLAGGLGNDVLNGGGGNDTTSGGAGDDTLTGGAGNDRMSGEAGNDVFIIADGAGNDFIFSFGQNGTEVDVLSLQGVAAITDFADLTAHHMVQIGVDVRIDLGTGEVLFLTSTQLSNLTAANFLF